MNAEWADLILSAVRYMTLRLRHMSGAFREDVKFHIQTTCYGYNPNKTSMDATILQLEITKFKLNSLLDTF